MSERRYQVTIEARVVPLGKPQHIDDLLPTREPLVVAVSADSNAQAAQIVSAALQAFADMVDPMVLAADVLSGEGSSR